MKEEIIKYIEKLFIGSIMVTTDKYPECIFHVYDKRLLRERKLNRIVGEKKRNVNVIFNYDEVKDKIVIEQDYKNNYFRLNYDKVTLVLMNKYGCTYKEISEIVNDWLNSDDKLKQLTTLFTHQSKIISLKSDDKLKQLTNGSHITDKFIGNL